jgi:hypothetical protein
MLCVIGYFKSMSLKFISLSAVLIFLSACASIRPPELVACNQLDWYELGRQDGAQGAAVERLEQHRRTCKQETFETEWETVYTNGRNAGLLEYCSSENGYELGRQGNAYFYVCPSTMEPQFLSGYRKGQQAHTLEIEIKKLDAKIELTVQKIVQTDSTYERNQLASELEQLKRSRAQNDQKLSRITRSSI